MDKTNKSRTQNIAILGLLLSLTITIQLAGLPQPITGPVINAIFFICTFLLGLKSGLILAFVSPFSALIRGHLPPILFPLLPFIITGNAALVFVYHFIYNKLFYNKIAGFISANCAGILAASIVKFLIIASAVNWAIPLLLDKPVPKPFVLMFTFPQLLTAIAGGVLFLISIKFLTHNKNQKKNETF